MISLFTALFLIVFGVIAYKSAEAYFRNGHKDRRIIELKQLLRLQKKVVKKKEFNAEHLSSVETQCKELFKEHDDLQMHEIYLTVTKAKDNEDGLETLIQQQKKLVELERDHQAKQGYKWYALFLVSIVTGFFLYFVFIPIINYAFVTSKDNSSLMEQLQTFLPSTTFDDVITDDFMVMSWDLNNRDPFILTKNSVKDVERYKQFDQLDKATLLSACNPLYFKPCKEDNGDNSVFISGNAIAESPAMYAFLYATEAGQDPANIAVVSVGSTLERPDKIPEDIGIIEWVTRIESLQGQSKRHSQDYLLNAVLNSYDRNLIKFQFPVSLEFEEELASKKNRLEDMELLKADMINENRMLIEFTMEAIVKERFASSNQC
uniref:Uncharacterized protein n=1 Tax=Strombidium inclinatum TaxID=197538 RepID=A0A7S3II86_9SPIT|mmetsp:Transcript_2034/g.3037  ORF Transcript_2034/g.3037 Transcript_2034/m.3037 type:complete len:376 (+) Transcript_2034:381-1508(+)